MELITLLLCAGTFALWVSNRSLKIRIDALEHQLGGGAPAAAVEVLRPEPVPVAPPSAPPPAAAPAMRQVDGPPAPPPEPRETLGGLFERLVAGRLLIWIGGAALAIAGVFLIRYSIGLITPEVRMIAAALFGGALLVAGEYARAGRLLGDDPRFAQALIGAGIAVLYATAYGSHILYGLLGTASASAAMLAVTGGALMLSLRHGAPTAVMGLAGGFLTPLLVGDPDAGAVPLLAYLALIDLAIFLIAWRRGWTWLAAAAVALSFVWSAWLLAQPADDALAAGVFVIVLALAASLVRLGKGRELGLIQPLAIGLVQLAMLIARTDLGLPAWALFGALAAAAMALAALRPGFGLAPPAALALALALLLAKSLTGQDPLVPFAANGITAIFGLGGLALSLCRRRLLWTLIACGGLAGPLLIVRAARPELLERPAWGGLALLLALGPVALVWLNRARASDKAPPDLPLITAGAAAALLAGVAVWDLLPADWVATGWLFVALLAAFAARRLGDLALTVIAIAAAAVAAARGLAMVPELWTATMAGLLGDPVLAAELPSALAALYALALPALLLAAFAFLLPGRKRWTIAALAGGFAAAACYVWFKQAFGLADKEDFVARGLIERTILTQALFLAGWLLASGRIKPPFDFAQGRPRIEARAVRIAGTMLTAVAAARLLWFDSFVYSPVLVRQWVGTLPVLNLILPAYLLSAFWLYLARRRARQEARSGFWFAAFLAALIAGVALSVRQTFHGAILTGPEMPIAEAYGYSLAGLIVAIGLLVAGIRLPDKALRLAGLLLLTATMLKVFLVDASQLEGALRILSFLGLGIALIGIGRLYGPVLRAERETA